MKITAEMPQVATCNVSACAYNRDKKCHAKAITVGDSDTPGCDTFFETDLHARDTGIIAGVGACKVQVCRYNKDLECAAPEIKVDRTSGGVRCMTFARR